MKYKKHIRCTCAKCVKCKATSRKYWPWMNSTRFSPWSIPNACIVLCFFKWNNGTIFLHWNNYLKQLQLVNWKGDSIAMNILRRHFVCRIFVCSLFFLCFAIWINLVEYIDSSFIIPLHLNIILNVYFCICTGYSCPLHIDSVRL